MTKEFLEGKRTEDEFLKRLGSLGERSTFSEDVNDHIDLKLNISFDVKQLKKINRKDTTPQDVYHWVELQNVRGRKGWLFGKATYIVFETRLSWLIVDRLHLIDYINDHVADEFVKSAKEALYKKYSRRNRNDIITLIPSIDLSGISTKILKKG